MLLHSVRRNVPSFVRCKASVVPPVSTSVWSSDTAHYQPPAKKVGSAALPWEELGFDYIPTNGHVRHVWKDGAWDDGTYFKDPYISVHMLGNVFHYGQSIFEGFKAYHTVDDRVCTF